MNIPNFIERYGWNEESPPTLIDELGGYDCAIYEYKNTLLDDDFPYVIKETGRKFTRPELAEELLEYRRQHNIYEKGDWVFYEVTGCIGDFIDHIKLDSGHPYCRVDFGLCDVGLIMLKHIRHAKDEELKARSA